MSKKQIIAIALAVVVVLVVVAFFLGRSTAPTEEPTTAPTEGPTTAPTEEPTTAPMEEPERMANPPKVSTEYVGYRTTNFYSSGKEMTSSWNTISWDKTTELKCYASASEAIENPTLFTYEFISSRHYFKDSILQLLLRNVNEVESITPSIIEGPDNCKITLHEELNIDNIYRTTIYIVGPQRSTSLGQILFEVTYQQGDNREHSFFAIRFEHNTN